MKVHNLTVCEEVRQEMNGKFILLGVYTNSILVNQFPAQFPLSVWTLLEAEETGSAAISLRLRMEEAALTLLEVKGSLEVQELENWTPFAFGGVVNVSNPGKLHVELKVDDAPWETLRVVNISRATFPLVQPPVSL